MVAIGQAIEYSPCATSCGVTLGLHTAPMADTADGCKSNFVLENLIGNTFPKGYHLFGGDGRQAGTYTMSE